jgi:hypothetical protein
VLTDRPKQLQLDVPRSVTEIVRAALIAYGREPLLFILLALGVVAPYELIVLAVSGSAPLAAQSLSVASALTLALIDFALIGPLVAALYVQAVIAIARGERPQLRDVAFRGLKVLPVVAAAQIVAGLGIGIGLFALIIPGILLAIHWCVVAQVAAAERVDWLGALRRSGELAVGHYGHVLGLILLTGAIAFGVTLAGSAIAGSSSHVPEVLLGIAVQTAVRMFTALCTTILYFDLLARQRALR